MYTKEPKESQNKAKQKATIHKKRVKRRRIRTGIAIGIAFLLGFVLGQKQESVVGAGYIEAAINEITGQQSKSVPTTEDVSIESDSIMAVAQPQKLSYDEAIANLTYLADADSQYADVISNIGIYPEALMVQLANNPEMLEFVQDYSEQKTTDEGTLSQEELAATCPLFLQWDERWGYDTYGDNILAVSGCGPTALSMVIVGLTHNEKATPANVGSYALDNDYYMYGTGTKWSLMSEGASHFGLDSQTIDIDENIMKQRLDKGDFIICSMGPGDFTANGHFIVIYGYDSTGFQVNDPFCIYRSGQTWDYEQLSDQIKSMWALGVK
ncbi:MAG: C39 family peptidase [Lachnotalea sp.]